MKLEDLISKIVEYHRSSDLSRNILSLPSKWRSRAFLTSMAQQLPYDDADFDTQTLETAIYYLFLSLGPQKAMEKCCDLPSLEKLLHWEIGESDIDYRTDDKEEVVERVLQAFSIPDPLIKPLTVSSASEVMCFLEDLERTLTSGRRTMQIKSLLSEYGITGIWTLVEDTLKLSIGYFCLHFESFLPRRIVQTFKQALHRRPINIVEIDEDEYTPLETGIAQLLELLEQQESPRYVDVLTYQSRLQEIITKSRLYGNTDTRTSVRNEICHQLNRLSNAELGISFNKLCNEAKQTADMEFSVGQSFQNLDAFFEYGELPEERENRRKEYEEKLRKIPDDTKRAERSNEFDVLENQIRKKKAKWIGQLRNECWRDFGRFSPFEFVNSDLYSQIGRLYQNPFAHRSVESLVGGLGNGEKKDISNVLREAKEIVRGLRKARALPRVIIILGSGTDNYGNRVVWFADRQLDEYPMPKCLEWAYFTSEMTCKPFQQMAMVVPETDGKKQECLMDPVIYPIRQIEAFMGNLGS